MRAFILMILFWPVTLSAQQKLEYIDKTYEPEIRTVMLYPIANVPINYLLPAITAIQQQNIVLEFDDLRDGYESYYAKLVHCNFDWTKSTLSDLEFMVEYNEVPINTYEFSSSLYLPYVHYKLNVPRVKLPGNYVLVVYRDGNVNDIVLSRRMMVYDNRTNLATTDQFAGVGTLQSSNQQINFIINYQNLRALNVLENFKVVIRQNQRWDNARMDVKPSFVRESRNELEYRFVDLDNQFNAGNEFRFVDFRSINFPGQNTASMNKDEKPYQLYVQKDFSREHQAYAQYPDLNGGYVIENLDYQDAEATATYVNVNFLLAAPKQVNGDVYVIGAFNNWARTNENKLTYVPSLGGYTTGFLLKQGRYDYQYWVDNSKLPGYHFEGSHFQTENRYEILVYFHSLQPRGDMLVGFFEIPVNAR